MSDNREIARALLGASVDCRCREEGFSGPRCGAVCATLADIVESALDAATERGRREGWRPIPTDDATRAAQLVAAWKRGEMDGGGTIAALERLADELESRGSAWRPIADEATVERMARALCESGQDFDWERGYETDREDCRKLARAALAAIPAPPAT